MHTRLPVAIERAAEMDADALMAVQKLAFANDLVRYGECPSYVEDRDVMLSKIRNSIFYKMSFNGQSIGGLELHRRSQTHYHVYMLCVHPDYHDHGIGRQALEFAFRAHPEIDHWTLVTPSGNGRSRHLYEKTGFVRTREIVHSPALTLVHYERLSSKLTP